MNVKIQDLVIIAVLIMWNMANIKWLSVFPGWHDIIYYKDLARSSTVKITLRFAFQTGLNHSTSHFIDWIHFLDLVQWFFKAQLIFFANIYLQKMISTENTCLSLLWHFSSSNSHFFPKWNDCISGVGICNTRCYISLTFLIYSLPCHMLIYHSMHSIKNNI